MRGVSTRWIVTVLAALLLAVPVWADEAAAPPDPPQGRMQPPVGVSSQARTPSPRGVFALVKLWLQSRLTVPNG